MLVLSMVLVSRYNEMLSVWLSGHLQCALVAEEGLDRRTSDKAAFFSIFGGSKPSLVSTKNKSNVFLFHTMYNGMHFFWSVEQGGAHTETAVGSFGSCRLDADLATCHFASYAAPMPHSTRSRHLAHVEMQGTVSSASPATVFLFLVCAPL